MQVKAALVRVRSVGDEESSFEKVSILLSDFGVYIKNEDSLHLFPWEKILEIKWDDMKVVERVWAEAVLDTLEDFMDDDFLDEIEAEEPEKETKPDDPNANPYE